MSRIAAGAEGRTSPGALSDSAGTAGPVRKSQNEEIEMGMQGVYEAATNVARARGADSEQLLLEAVVTQLKMQRHEAVPPAFEFALALCRDVATNDRSALRLCLAAERYAKRMARIARRAYAAAQLDRGIPAMTSDRQDARR